MLVSNYKHGLSYTKEYQTTLSHKRKEMANELDSEWTVEMQIVLDEFQTKCAVCGMTLKEHLNKYGKSLSTDHVIPLSKGGSLKPGNAIKMCISCNSTKHDKMLSELPLDWQANIIWSAFSFRNHWDKHQQILSDYKESL
jgi:5-methylcytosine-specific restriction endonuclease McrA